MAVVIHSGTTTSLTAGSKSAELAVGKNQFVGKGRIQLSARASAAAATGIHLTLSVGGVTLMDDALIPYAGTTGGLSVRDNMIVDQMTAGGYVSFTARNDSAGTLTFDDLLVYTP